MDAILEYTSMSRLPGVFLEDGQPAAINPTLQSTEMLTLPQRMEGNRLHRFSKVQKNRQTLFTSKVYCAEIQSFFSLIFRFHDFCCHCYLISRFFRIIQVFSRN